MMHLDRSVRIYNFCRLRQHYRLALFLLCTITWCSTARADAVAFWNTYLGQQPVLECWNSSNNTEQTSFILQNTAGQTIHQIDVPLLAHTTRHFVIASLLPEDQIGTLVQPFVDKTSILCHLFHYRLSSLNQVEFTYSTTLLTESKNEYFYIVNSHQPWPLRPPVQNWLSIYNCGSTAITPQIDLHRADGVFLRTLAEQPLAAKERRDILVSDLDSYALSAVHISSTAGSCIHTALNRVNFSPGAPSFITPIPSDTNSSNNSSIHFSTMHEMNSWLELANPTNAAQTLNISIHAQNGGLLHTASINVAAFGQEHLNLNSFIGGNALGSLRVQSAGGQPVHAQALQYGNSDKAFWGIASSHSTATTEHYLPGNSFLNAHNWISSVNEDSLTMIESLKVFDASGAQTKSLSPHIISNARHEFKPLDTFNEVAAVSASHSSLLFSLSGIRAYTANNGSLITLGHVAAIPIKDDTISIDLQLLTDALTQPIEIVPAPDSSNRIFILEKTGKVRVFQNGSLLAGAFLDLSAAIRIDGEHGLLGLAFPEDFATSKVFYVHYSDTNGDTTIARWQTTADLSAAQSGSEEIILKVPQPRIFHNGGTIAFGPDGYLYIALGDGGGVGDPFANGQDPTTLLGSILRIEVSPAYSGYRIPTDNPFVGSSSGADEVFAYGLRNPWKMSFDSSTSRLFVADVGQNTREEINLVTAGKNYGWNTMEGTICFSPSTNCDKTGLELPILEYGRDIGVAVIGGKVYRGNNIPLLHGLYVYGDYISGAIWAAEENVDGTWAFRQIGQMPENTFLTSFGSDASGELYVVDITGKLFKLTASP